MAQSFEASIHGGQSKLSNNDIGSASTAGGSTYSLGDGFRLGFRMTLNNARFFGHEFGYAYNRSQLNLAGQSQGGMAIHQGFYNFLAYATKEGRRVRPFVTGGGHFSNFVPPGASASSGGGDNKFGYNYGGGLKVRVSEIFMIRFDVRQYQTGKPFGLTGTSGMLKQNEFSIGFGLAL